VTGRSGKGSQLRELIERDGGGVGDIEAFDAALDRQFHQGVAMADRTLAQALALGAHDQGDIAAKIRLADRQIGRAVEPQPPIAQFGQFVQRPAEVGDPDPRQNFQRAGGGFGERARFRRRMPFGTDDGAGAEGGGGADDRADIMGIGHLVEDQRQMRFVPADPAAVRKVSRRQGPGQQGDPLMNAVIRQQVFEHFGGDNFRFEGRLYRGDPADLRAILPEASLGQQQAAHGPFPVGEGGDHRMMAKEPQIVRAGRRRRGFLSGGRAFARRLGVCRGAFGGGLSAWPVLVSSGASGSVALLLLVFLAHGQSYTPDGGAGQPQRQGKMRNLQKQSENGVFFSAMCFFCKNSFDMTK